MRNSGALYPFMEAGIDYEDKTTGMMRFLKLMILIGFLFLFACSGSTKKSIPADVVNIPNTAEGNGDQENLPVMTFSSTEHDFGKMVSGEVVTYSFKFKNTGKSDLVIAGISASCGCTASRYPNMPVKPGEENYIEVSFDSNAKMGFQHKTLTVAANTQPSSTVLSIKAVVIAPESQ